MIVRIFPYVMRVGKLYPKLVHIHVFSCWYKCSVNPTKNKSLYVLRIRICDKKLCPQIYFTYVGSVIFVPKVNKSTNIDHITIFFVPNIFDSNVAFVAQFYYMFYIFIIFCLDKNYTNIHIIKILVVFTSK